MKIELDLTKKQWAELINAVHTKAEQIRNGDYGELEEDLEDLANWENELNEIYYTLTDFLDKHNIAY